MISFFNVPGSSLDLINYFFISAHEIESASLGTQLANNQIKPYLES